LRGFLVGFACFLKQNLQTRLENLTKPPHSKTFHLILD
jgi:hypothetical protein